MYTEWMRTEIDDTLDSISERAMARARETGTAQQFQYDGVLYRVDPAPPELQTIQVLGDVRRDFARSQAEAEIMRCSGALGVDWTIENIFLDCVTRVGGYLLVAGEDTRWLEDVRNRLCERLRADNPKHIGMATRRRVVIMEGPIVVFETYMDSAVFRGMTFEVAYLQEQEKDVMGGNYNEFPYRSMNRDRERYLEREEQKARREARWADFQRIEKDRMEMLEQKAAQERRQEQEKFAMLKPRSIGQSMLAMQMLQAKQALLDQIQYDNSRNPFMMMETTAWGSNTYPTYGGISRGPQTAEDRLAVVRDVLLEHLRFQLQQAPSMGALYANDVKAITANDIRRVVEALEPGPNFMPQMWGMGVDFSAEAKDGSKIVLSGEKRFQSGVIFDPANRPIRKFRLKEESAA